MVTKPNQIGRLENEISVLKTRVTILEDINNRELKSIQTFINKLRRVISDKNDENVYESRK